MNSADNRWLTDRNSIPVFGTVLAAKDPDSGHLQECWTWEDKETGGLNGLIAFMVDLSYPPPTCLRRIVSNP